MDKRSSDALSQTLLYSADARQRDLEQRQQPRHRTGCSATALTLKNRGERHESARGFLHRAEPSAVLRMPSTERALSATPSQTSTVAIDVAGPRAPLRCKIGASSARPRVDFCTEQSLQPCYGCHPPSELSQPRHRRLPPSPLTLARERRSVAKSGRAARVRELPLCQPVC